MSKANTPAEPLTMGVGPRPPVPGEDNAAQVSTVGSHAKVPVPGGDDSPTVLTPRKSSLHAPQYYESQYGEPPLGYEPEGSCADTPPDAEQPTPPYLRWAESLPLLLQDAEGVSLFRRYLEQEQCLDMLDFWFACQGLKKQQPGNEAQIQQLIKVIYRKYLRSHTVRISEALRKQIGNRIASKQNLDQTVFDDAQIEVECLINETTYPNFLKSDIYISFVRSMQGGGTSSSSSGDAGVCRTSTLPTVHEDSELTQLSTMTLTRDALLVTQKFRESKPKPEAVAGHSSSMDCRVSNPYHARYSSYHTTSRQDSELQSLSSGAHTDDTRSLTDSSIDGRSSKGFHFSKRQMRKQHRQMKESASMNRELSTHHHVIPRTQRMHREQLKPMKPEEFVNELIPKLEMLKKKQDAGDILNQRLGCQPGDDLRSTVVSAGLLQDALREICTADYASDQAILDEHVSRIWADSRGQTPSRSPIPQTPPSGDPYRRRSYQLPSSTGIKQTTGSLPPPSYVPRPSAGSTFHHRRKEKDVFSTMSSDSGTVLYDLGECSDSSQRYFSLPKSRSMPEHIIDTAGNTMRASSRRSSKKTSAELTDSGVSVVSETPPAHPASERVMTWMLENDRYSSAGAGGGGDSDKDSSLRHRSTRSTASPCPPRHSRQTRRPPLGYSPRSTSLERGAPSSTDNPMTDLTTQLEEVRRRLADDVRLKAPSKQRSSSLGRSTHPVNLSLPPSGTRFPRSRGTPQPPPVGVQPMAPPETGDHVIVGYKYCDETMPYRTTLPGKEITLAQFKQTLPKKGNYRFFFKTRCEDFDTMEVLQEVTNDESVLPLWDGKVFGIVRLAE